MCLRYFLFNLLLGFFSIMRHAFCFTKKQTKGHLRTKHKQSNDPNYRSIVFRAKYK